MKRIKFLFVFSMVFVLAGTLYAFDNSKESCRSNVINKVAIVKYLYVGVHPTTRVSIDNPSNWILFINPDPCDHLGCKLCSITFDNSTLTLVQAISLIPVLQCYLDGQVYSSGSKNVTVRTKS